MNNVYELKIPEFLWQGQTINAGDQVTSERDLVEIFGADKFELVGEADETDPEGEPEVDAEGNPIEPAKKVAPKRKIPPNRKKSGGK